MFILTVTALEDNATKMGGVPCVLGICRVEFLLLDLGCSEQHGVGPDDLQVSSNLNYSVIQIVFNVFSTMPYLHDLN